MAWLLLTIAGVLEVGFALCMKSSDGFTRPIPSLLTIAFGLSSVIVLSFSLRSLPVGTGYAVWTGIGAAGTSILGITMFGDPASPARLLCIGLIVCGAMGLKIAA